MKKSWQRREFIKTAAITGLSAGFLQPFSMATPGLQAGNRKAFAGKRVGIIGLDTSHATAFSNTLNKPLAGDKYKGYKIVAAYPRGSFEIKSSYERIPGYIEQVKANGVEIVESVKELLTRVDVVMLETNDGRMHKEQALEVIKAGKPMFIDKPMANSAKDVVAIFEAARAANVPVFSSSSLRFGKGVQAILNGKVGKVLGADTFSPSPLEKTHTDFFWYGIHGIEMLFAIMGAGCETVTRFNRPDMDLVVGTWKDGRIGSFRGLRTPKTGYGGNVFGEKGIADLEGGFSYDDLLIRIVDFFETGISPVPQQETIEIAAFIDAAQKSKRKKGRRVSLAPYLK